ncbi:hypothetical protein ACWEVY_28755 [Streptomyces longwoodensis]
MSEKVTEQQSYDNIFGVGGFTYSWWEGRARAWKWEWDGRGDVPDGWAYVIKADNPTAEGSIERVVNHWALIGAMNAIAHPDEPWGVDAGPVTARECRAFLYDPDEADFDAGTADAVLQVAVFGAVHYG